MTPVIPSDDVSATMTSTGLAVAQKMEHTFRAVLYLVQNVDRECAFEQDAEYVARPDILKIFDADVRQSAVVALGPDKAGAGCLCEGNSVLGMRNCCRNNFIKVFSGFYKMCLAEYNIAVRGNIY